MKIRTIISILFVALLFAGCNKEPQTITVKNLYRLTIPGYMSEAKEMNKKASLQYENQAKELYVMALYESKKQLSSQFKKGFLNLNADLETYSAFVSHTTEEQVGADELELTPVKINGLDARITSFTGKINNVDIFWKVAYIEGKDNFYQVICWTTPASKEKLMPAIDGVINSFKEIK